MPAKPPRGPRLKTALATRIVRSTGPINRLRARRFGSDVLRGKPPELELYYEPGDPHSHLGAQLLGVWRSRVQVPLKVHVVGEPEPDTYPEVEKQRRFALEDCSRIAPAWGLEFPERANLPSASEKLDGARILCASGDLTEFLAREREVANMLFSGNTDRLHSSNTRWPRVDADSARQQLADNGRRRARLGHYLPGMWQFNGEWFWGVDRLNHLEARLRDKQLLKGSAPLAELNPGRARLPALSTPFPPLEFYFSFRSPYSHLAALQVQRAFDDLPLDLHVRPVLPMAMRGMKIVINKALYIPRDVYREAQALGLPFTPANDPLGAATERCLTVFNTAETKRQQIDYLASAVRAIWTEAVDLTGDAGMRHVCERAGLDWQAAKAKLDAGIDLAAAENNRTALFEAGLWGVPCFKLGDFATWGRDRIWMVDEIMRRSGFKPPPIAR